MAQEAAIVLQQASLRAGLHCTVILFPLTDPQKATEGWAFKSLSMNDHLCSGAFLPVPRGPLRKKKKSSQELGGTRGCPRKCCEKARLDWEHTRIWTWSPQWLQSDKLPPGGLQCPVHNTHRYIPNVVLGRQWARSKHTIITLLLQTTSATCRLLYRSTSWSSCLWV